MGIFSGLLGGVGKAAEGIGSAINKNVKTLRGDVAEKETHLHEEQMAVLAQLSAEYVARPTRTVLDSAIDFLNRLPRPMFAFGILYLFFYAWKDPGGFVDLMSVLQIVPDAVWTMLFMIVGFFYGSRVISEDLRGKTKLTAEQKALALEIIRKRAEALEKATEHDIIIAIPTPEPTLPPSKLPNVPQDTNSAVAVDIMIEDILHIEGGFIQHPSDRGGATNHGITLNTLAAYRGFPVTVDDVKALKRTEAADILRANYYILPGIDTLPAQLQAHVTDCSVNHGPRAAVRLLQRTLNNMGERLAVDGVIGDATRDACRKHDTGKINQALVEMRLRFYNDICAANPSQRVFLKGWERRARSFSTGPGIAA